MNNFNEKKTSAKVLVQMALFVAIILILGLTSLGFIPIGIIQVTTVQIPVIVGSVLLGPRKGALLGLIFGLTSFITAHMNVTPVSYFFSPLISGNFFSLVVCFVPRIFVGILPYYVYNILKKIIDKNTGLVIAGLVGALTNTVFVMGFIYIFFKEEYAKVLGTTAEALFIVIISNIGLNAVIEAIASSILTFAICRTLLKIIKED